MYGHKCYHSQTQIAFMAIWSFACQKKNSIFLSGNMIKNSSYGCIKMFLSGNKTKIAFMTSQTGRRHSWSGTVAEQGETPRKVRDLSPFGSLRSPPRQKSRVERRNTLNLRTSTSQKCEAIPRRARIIELCSLNSRLRSNEEEERRTP